MRGQELLVGLGDSSFYQLPHFSAGSSHHVDDERKTKSSYRGKISQISPGATAVVALTTDGSVLEWGTCLYGERLSPATAKQRGERPSSNHPIPVVFSPPPPLAHRSAVKLVALNSGAHFVVAALDNGGCVSWGGGRYAHKVLGRGGCGSCGSCSISSPVAAAPPRSSIDWVAAPLGPRGLKVEALAAGDNHAIAVCGDGRAWAWGADDCGQLGLGASFEAPGACCGGTCVPVMVTVPPQAVVRGAACGRDHSAVLTSDGRVWTFGSSLHGQLGLGTVGEMCSSPKVVSSLEGVGTMRTDGSFTGIASIACGAWHTAALSTTGDIYAWGWARFGALGPYPPRSEPWCGRSTKSGDAGGALSSSDFRTSTDSGGGRNLLAAEGKNEAGEVRPYPGLVDGVDALLADDHDQLVSVACGARYTLALSRRKRAFVWGQVEPPKDYGMGGRKMSHSCACSGPGVSGGKACWLGPCSSPRELKPEELIRAAEEATTRAEVVEGDEKGRYRASSVGGKPTVNETTVGAGCKGGVLRHNGGSESGWRISVAGCGPWYIVFGLEEEDEEYEAAPLDGREGK